MIFFFGYGGKDNTYCKQSQIFMQIRLLNTAPSLLLKGKKLICCSNIFLTLLISLAEIFNKVPYAFLFTLFVLFFPFAFDIAKL